MHSLLHQNLTDTQKQELNEVLHFIAGSDVRLSPHSAPYIYRKFEKIRNMDYSDFLRRIEKLSRDEHLEKSHGPDGETVYVMTAAGKDFDGYGGYAGSQKQSNITTQHSSGTGIYKPFVIGIVVVLMVILVLWYYYK